MKSKAMFQTALGLCTAALIAGCGQQPGAPNAAVYRPAYVLSVDLAPGDTAQSVAASHHGRVMAFDREAGYALIGMDEAAAKQFNQSRVGALALEPSAEPNIGVFTGGGMIATMNGRVRLWAGGRVRLWAGGSYDNVPENVGTFNQIKLQDAQNLAPNLGKGVKVAVIDTGLDLSHPAFAGSLDLANAKDYVDGDNMPQDVGILGLGGYGHGTSVASIVLQIAPNATILPIRVLGSDGSGDVANVAAAITYAVDKGAKVINLSLGSDVKVDAVQRAIEYAASKNVFVVSSAGNDNKNVLTYPAMQATDGKVNLRSLSVGSVDSFDRKSSFSNYSDKLEVTAPGEQIVTAAPDNQAVAWSGTSMAAPMVSGGLALALGQLQGYLGSLPADQLKTNLDLAQQKLLSGAQDLNSLNGAYKDRLGRRLDLQKFINSAVYGQSAGYDR